MSPGTFFKRQRQLMHATPDFLWIDRGEPHLQSIALQWAGIPASRGGSSRV
jgi:hypothetical protein